MTGTASGRVEGRDAAADEAKEEKEAEEAAEGEEMEEEEGLSGAGSLATRFAVYARGSAGEECVARALLTYENGESASPSPHLSNILFVCFVF